METMHATWNVNIYDPDRVPGPGDTMAVKLADLVRSTIQQATILYNSSANRNHPFSCEFKYLMQILASKTSISHRSKSQENKCRLSLLPLLRLPQKIALNCQTYGSNTWMWAFLKWRAKKIMPEKLKSTLFVLTKNISFLSQSFGWKGILKSKYWWGMGNVKTSAVRTMVKTSECSCLEIS